MHFGLGVLRLAPQDFWTMTPRELAAAAGLSMKPGALSRADFGDLLKRHPDKENQHG